MNDYIELIRNEFKYALLTNNEAKEIYKAIEDIIDEDLIKQFIKEELRVFRRKKDAFGWFIEEDFMLSDFKRVEITKSDIPERGISLYDLVIDSVLESYENYLQLKDDLYITWWM